MAARSARTQSKDSTPSSARAFEEPAESTFIPVGMQKLINVSDHCNCSTVNMLSLPAMQKYALVRRACSGDGRSSSAGDILFYMAAGRGTPLSRRGSSAVGDPASESKGMWTITDST